MTASAMSIPAVTPPPVKMMPSRTTRPESCVTPKSASLSRHAQWQAARLPLQQTRGREQQRARAHRGDVARLCAEAAQRREIGLVFNGCHGTEPAGYAEQIAFVDAVESAKPGEAHDGVHLEFAAVDRREHAACAGQAGEHFVGSGEVELGDAREEREDDVEWGGHGLLRQAKVLTAQSSRNSLLAEMTLFPRFMPRWPR